MNKLKLHESHDVLESLISTKISSTHFTRLILRAKSPNSLRGFDILLQLDDKGDVSTRDNGSGLGRLSRLESDLGRASMTKNNFSLYYNRANLRLVEDLEHNGW
ncbi:hypothetical protein GQ457_01G019160 [Hibiscus cannabinus]